MRAEGATVGEAIFLTTKNQRANYAFFVQPMTTMRRVQEKNGEIGTEG
jgi:hypothetical protein